MSTAIEKDFLRPEILSDPFAFYAESFAAAPIRSR